MVFTLVTDPVGQGLVETLIRPGGTITGFTTFEPTVSGKWVQILKEIAPETKRTTVMVNPDVAPYYRMYMSSMESAAATLAVGSDRNWEAYGKQREAFSCSLVLPTYF